MRVVATVDSRGIRHLATLLAKPGTEFHALDLMAPTAGRAVLTDADALIDETARHAYRRRVDELTETIGEADARGDR